MESRGDVTSIKFSPDRRILAVQRSPKSVVCRLFSNWYCYLCLKTVWWYFSVIILVVKGTLFNNTYHISYTLSFLMPGCD